MTRDEINAFGAVIQSKLLDGDGAILTAVGAMPPSTDCHVSTCLATVEGAVGHEVLSFTSTSVTLDDAIHLARGKLRDARAKLERDREKAKAERVSA